MFDKTKKAEDESNTGKQKHGKACPTLQNKTTEEILNIELKLDEPDPNEEIPAIAELETLEEEWQKLLEEKTQLEKTEKMLRKKVMEEIKARKRKIETLRKQIPVLKERCETLAKMLDIKIQK
jgi:seryl-tRNA synthetase